MNRRIKTRVWNSGKWIEKFYIDKDGFVYDWNANILIDAIVVQLTGLYDSNDKEICEGDILADFQGFVGVVHWLQLNVEFIIIDADEWVSGNREEPNYILDDTGGWPALTVVGNIHENPELIE